MYNISVSNMQDGSEISKLTMSPLVLIDESLYITDDFRQFIASYWERAEDSRLAMPRLSPELLRIQRLYTFILQVNDDIKFLNERISAYNLATTLAEKRSIWNEINQRQKEIDNKYPDSVIMDCPDYRTAFYYELFSDLKRQNYHLNAYENPAVGLSSHRPVTWTLPEFMAVITPEKLSKLTAILASNPQNIQSELKLLYKSGEPGYHLYQRFLKAHSISFLGGGNSVNYKVTNLSTGDSLVLKVDGRLDIPKDIAAHMSTHALSGVIVPEIASRRCRFTLPNGADVVRNLVVKEYCEGGNLDHDAKSISDPKAKVERALDIYVQMADIIMNLQQANGAFTDMKNANWLLREGRLQIADDKSLLMSNSAGEIDRNSEWYYKVIRTEGMDPEEFHSDDPIIVDKMHAYQWGKNLYEYLTGRIYNTHDGKFFSFNFPVFNTPEGRLLKKLIINTVVYKVEDRKSMTYVQAKITEIYAIKNARNDCLNLIQAARQRRGLTAEEDCALEYLQKKSYNELSLSSLVSLKQAVPTALTYLKNDALFQGYLRCSFLLEELNTLAEKPMHAPQSVSILELNDRFEGFMPKDLVHNDSFEALLQSKLNELQKEEKFQAEFGEFVKIGDEPSALDKEDSDGEENPAYLRCQGLLDELLVLVQQPQNASHIKNVTHLINEVGFMSSDSDQWDNLEKKLTKELVEIRQTDTVKKFKDMKQTLSTIFEVEAEAEDVDDKEKNVDKPPNLSK